MMDSPALAPWHKASFDRFLYHGLPELLTGRLHLAGYRAEPDGAHACRIVLRARAGEGGVEVAFSALPAPDEEGVFRLAEPPPAAGPVGPAYPQDTGQRWSAAGADLVVLPRADRDDPSEAHIACVGEQLCRFIDERLGQVPTDAALDAVLIRTLAPLDAWFRAFLAAHAQQLNGNNWLDRATHLRRLLVLDRQVVFTPGHFGRTCPFETPEGPNIGRVLTIARGAAVQDGRLVVLEEGPLAGLGLAASAVPFLEHDDGNRLLMGVNMMRQWLPPSEPEPALVQTGLEPDVPGFWCGRNLLTAFVSWDGYAYEDGLVLSRSAAARLACPLPLEPGDKLSNRHGTKGVVARVLPDEQMPQLPDGTPVDLIFGLSGVPTRWSFGQLREAALGRVARTEGRPAIVPPYAAPSDAELHRRLQGAGLPETGVETLRDHGQPLRRPCTVGWVYWGCTVHLARAKVRASTEPRPAGSCMRVGRMEVEMLHAAGAPAVLRELTNTCADERPDAPTLAARVAAGPVLQPDTPSPALARIVQKLGSLGIRAQVAAAGLAFRPGEAEADALALARPVAHPWLPDAQLTTVPRTGRTELVRAVEEASGRLAALAADRAPEPLVAAAHERLAHAVQALFDGTLDRADLRPGGNALFSGKAVIAPGPDLRPDQLGVPEEMAWTLFGPQVARALGGAPSLPAVEQRTAAAATALDGVLAASWVVLNRAPSVTPTALMAFHPVRVSERVLRLHPLACLMLNADFDGDQAAVFVPVTDAAQREAGEKLSIRGHLERDPDLVAQLCPPMDALFGLACLSRAAAGRRAIGAAAGRAPRLTGGILRRDGVVEVLRGLLASQGPDAALSAAAALMRLGFEAARREGGSVSPFAGETATLFPTPYAADADQWAAYTEEAQSAVASFSDYDDADLGALCLLAHCGARGSAHQLVRLMGPAGTVRDVRGRLVPVRHGWRQGLTPEEVEACVVGARGALFRLQEELQGLGAAHEERTRPAGSGVLSRARRAARPGVVFARAAARGEVDPLTDQLARMLLAVERP